MCAAKQTWICLKPNVLSDKAHDLIGIELQREQRFGKIELGRIQSCIQGLYLLEHRAYARNFPDRVHSICGLQSRQRKLRIQNRERSDPDERKPCSATQR